MNPKTGKRAQLAAVNSQLENDKPQKQKAHYLPHKQKLYIFTVACVATS